jgi:hypothetical protein
LVNGEVVWIMDVLDDHSRVLVAVRAVQGPTAQAAWEAFSHGVHHWGIPARVMSDNGVCFTGRFSGTEAAFERQLRYLGVEHLLSSPGHPQTCGKLERSHQTTKRWLRQDGPVDSIEAFQDQLDRWQDHYNNHRPHSALGGATPATRWHTTSPAQPGDPVPGPRRTSLHTVNQAGTISWGHFTIGVGSPLAGQRVLAVAAQDQITIHSQAGIVRTLTIDRTRRYQPSGKPVGRPPRQHP